MINKILYVYQMNIKTQELKIIEAKVKLDNDEELNNRTFYTLTIKKDNKPMRIHKRIRDIYSFDVERNGLYVSACSFDDSKVEEFKFKCIEHVNEYKRRCEETIKSLTETIDWCNNSLKIVDSTKS